MTKGLDVRCFPTLLPFAAERLPHTSSSRDNYLWSSITECGLHTPPFPTIAKNSPGLSSALCNKDTHRLARHRAHDSSHLIICTESKLKICREVGTREAGILLRRISQKCLQFVPSLIANLEKSPSASCGTSQRSCPGSYKVQFNICAKPWCQSHGATEMQLNYHVTEKPRVKPPPPAASAWNPFQRAPSPLRARVCPSVLLQEHQGGQKMWPRFVWGKAVSLP